MPDETPSNSQDGTTPSTPPATPANFAIPGAYGEQEITEIKSEINVGDNVVNQKAVGTFVVNPSSQVPKFDSYARLTSSAAPYRKKVDGIRTKSNEKEAKEVEAALLEKQRLEQANEDIERMRELVVLSVGLGKVTGIFDNIKKSSFFTLFSKEEQEAFNLDGELGSEVNVLNTLVEDELNDVDRHSSEYISTRIADRVNRLETKIKEVESDFNIRINEAITSRKQESVEQNRVIRIAAETLEEFNQKRETAERLLSSSTVDSSLKNRIRSNLKVLSDSANKLRSDSVTKEEVEGFKKISGETPAKMGVERKVSPNARVTLRPKNGSGPGLTVSVKEWRDAQKESAKNSNLEKEEQKSKARADLMEMHRKMWERDKEGYKALYVNRIWKAGDELTQSVVKELIGEKSADIETLYNSNSSTDTEGKIARHNALRVKGRDYGLTETELTELDNLSKEDVVTRALELAEESTSLDSLPYEEQLKMMRKQQEKNERSLKNERQTYDPSMDKGVDWIGFDGRVLTKEEKKRGKIANFDRGVAKFFNVNDTTPGISTQTNGLRTDEGSMFTSDEIMKKSEGLAKKVLPQEVTLNNKEQFNLQSGMTRSVDSSDRFLKVNKDAQQIQPMAQETVATSTPSPESVQARKKKVDDLTKTLEKWLGKKSRRDEIGMWLLTAALASGGTFLYSKYNGTNPEKAPIQSSQTLESALSWKDFIGTLKPSPGFKNMNEIDLKSFAADLAPIGRQPLIGYNDFMNTYIPSLSLKDGNLFDNSKLQMLNGLTVGEILNGNPTGVFTNQGVRSELSSLVTKLILVRAMTEAHKNNVNKFIQPESALVYAQQNNITSTTIKNFFDDTEIRVSTAK